MSKIEMCKISIVGLKENEQDVLEKIQDIGIIQPIDICENIKTTSRDTNINTLKLRLKSAEEALDIINTFSETKDGILNSLKLAHKKTSLSLSGDDLDKINEIAKRILLKYTKILELTDLINKSEEEIEQIKSWTELDINMNIKETEKTAVFIGLFHEKLTHDEIIKKYKSFFKDNDKYLPIEFSVISFGDSETKVLAITLKKYKDRVNDILKAMGFVLPSYIINGVPKEKIKDKRQAIFKYKKEINKLKNAIIDDIKYKNMLMLLVDYSMIKIEKYEALKNISESEKFFVLFGYIPKPAKSYAKEILTKDCALFVSVTNLSENEKKDAPVMLKNNILASPVEGVLETYSLPGSREIDPSFVMAVFYYILFGLMLSDAGYGLVMSIGCFLALMRFNDMDMGLKKTLRMFFFCGLSAVFWGVMFGSYFGDALSVISTTFLGRNISIPPLWFQPIDEPMKMLMFSFGIGIVHIFTGLFLKLYSTLKRHDYSEAICGVLFWYLLVGGLVVYFMGSDMFKEMSGVNINSLSKYSGFSLALACIGALGIIMFGARETKNPFKRIFKGIYELYGVTNYLSDILSYSRLLALGLATSVIAQVFNQMASMMGGGIIGGIFFVIIFVIGHSLNLGINLLGAYVHTNRLQFVEFFGKFYEGGGEKFKPLSKNSKYYKF